MSGSYFVYVKDVMTGGRELVPIRGLPFCGPYLTDRKDERGNAIVADNLKELERLAGEIGFGNKITINLE